ncbi:MAG: hypothetical protein WDW38_009180 [Sanguina aurantia]
MGGYRATTVRAKAPRRPTVVSAIAAMLARNFARQRQAESGAIGATGHQRQEQRVAQRRRHARAVIGYVDAQRHAQHAVAPTHAVFHARAQTQRLRTGLLRVAREIEQDLLQASRVAQHIRHARVVIVAQGYWLRLGLQQVRKPFQQMMDIDRAKLRRAVVMQQPVGASRQRGEPIGFVDDQAGELLQVFRADAPVQQLRGTAKSGKRVFHFVRKAAQGRRQRRTAHRRFGEGVNLHQQVAPKRLEHDIDQALAATTGPQRHSPQLQQALLLHSARAKLRARLATASRQQRRRGCCRSAEVRAAPARSAAPRRSAAMSTRSPASTRASTSGAGRTSQQLHLLRPYSPGANRPSLLARAARIREGWAKLRTGGGTVPAVTAPLRQSCSESCLEAGLPQGGFSQLTLKGRRETERRCG